MSKPILVLSSAEIEPNLSHLKTFTDKLSEQLGPATKVLSAHYKDLVFHLKTDAPSFRIEGLEPEIKDFGLVFFKTHIRYTEIAAAAADILGHLNIPFLSSELDGAISQTKLTQYTRLAAAGLPIPESFYAYSSSLPSHIEEIGELFGYPFICKATDAKGGDLNYLIKTPEEMAKRLSQNPQTEFISQRFLPNDFDYRILVIGGQVKVVFERRRTGEGHLNNTSQGARAEMVEIDRLDPSILKMAQQAASLLKREVAGVDVLINNQTGEAVILEVNAAPQLASGAYVEQKISAMADYLKRLNNSL